MVDHVLAHVDFGRFETGSRNKRSNGAMLSVHAGVKRNQHRQGTDPAVV